MMSMPWGSSGGIQPYGGGQMHTEKAGKGQSRGPTRREDEEPWLAGHDSPLTSVSPLSVSIEAHKQYLAYKPLAKNMYTR